MIDLSGIAALIASGASITTAVIGVATFLRTTRMQEHLEVVRENIQKVELATNSMKDQLVLATAEASQAKGLAEGIAKERANPQIPYNKP
jgi:hypothetical protein